MVLKKIRLDFKYCEKGRFFRTFLVNMDLNLVDFGCAIVTSIKARYEHNFLFTNKNNNFVPRVFMEEYVEDGDVLINNYSVKDLTDSFEFTYDTGEGWDFSGKVYKKEYASEDKTEIVLIDGKGLGIFENDITTLIDYLEGKVNPNGRNKTMDKNGHALPYNLDMKCYKDFDNYVKEKEIVSFYDQYMFDKIEYKKGEANYFGEKYVKTEDELEYEKAQKEFFDAFDELIDNILENEDDIIEIYEQLKIKYKKKKARDILEDTVYRYIVLGICENEDDFELDVDGILEDLKKHL